MRKDGKSGGEEWGRRDIYDRCFVYSTRAVNLFRFLRKTKDEAGWTIGKQFLRSATSIGANMAEASAAETRKDFVHKCSIAQKEARESTYWLQVLAKAEVVPEARLTEILGETRELTAIITVIGRNARRNAS